MGPSENLQVKADGPEKQKSGRKYKIAYGKHKIFSTATTLLRGVAGGLMGFCLASGDLKGSQVASGVMCGFRGLPWGSRIALRVTDGLMGSQMASGAAGGLLGSWVAMRGSAVASGGRS
jgi:hypothetical protein